MDNQIICNNFSDWLKSKMQETNTKPSELAKDLGVTMPYINKLLKHGNNFTLKTMGKVTDHFDSILELNIVDKVS